MDPEDDYKPFEVVEEDGRTILRLHGRAEQRIKVEADKVHIIMDAIALGWDVDVRYADIDGDLDIRTIADQFEKGRKVIKGRIKITHSTINGNAFFRSAIFNEGADFRSATFSGNADFGSATFNGNADFRSAIFSGDASFRSATLSGDTSFSSVTFSGSANFSSTTFSGSASFRSAKFTGDTDFSKAQFGVSAGFDSVKMLYPASFAEVNICQNTSWAALKNEILIPIVRKLSAGRVKLQKRPVTNFLAFNTTTVMDSSFNPRLKRYIDDEQWINSWRESGELQRVILYFWEATSHCGRSIGLWMAWSVFFIFLFTLFYTPAPHWLGDSWGSFWQKYGALFEQTTEAYKGETPGFWSCLYFSIVNFITLGFGDIVAANAVARFLVGFEVVVGYVMLGGLISIFASKLARRS